MKRYTVNRLGIINSILLFGTIGCGIGAGIGAYFSDKNIYIIIGALIGNITGFLIGKFAYRVIAGNTIISIERLFKLVAGLTCIFLAIAGIIGFIITKEPIGVIGALFFGLGGLILLLKKKMYIS